MALLDHDGGIEFPYHKDDVFDALLRAIPTIKGMQVDKADKLAGHIFAKAGMSLWSWGENIPISVIEVSHGRTRVSITSTPKTGVMFGGAFDMGKNRKNIELIMAETSSILRSKLPVQASTKHETESVEERILKLNHLLEKSLITQEEFQRKKVEILSQI
jgi:hypothetical protein